MRQVWRPVRCRNPPQLIARWALHRHFSWVVRDLSSVISFSVVHDFALICIISSSLCKDCELWFHTSATHLAWSGWFSAAMALISSRFYGLSPDLDHGASWASWGPETRPTLNSYLNLAKMFSHGIWPFHFFGGLLKHTKTTYISRILFPTSRWWRKGISSSMGTRIASSAFETPSSSTLDRSVVYHRWLGKYGDEPWISHEI